MSLGVLAGIAAIILGVLVLVGVDDPVTLLAIAVIILGAALVLPLVMVGYNSYHRNPPV